MEKLKSFFLNFIFIIKNIIMKFIKYFITTEEKESFDTNDECLSYTEDEDQSFVKDADYDYSQDYFTCIALTDGIIQYTSNQDTSTVGQNNFSYSINNGEWSEYASSATINVVEGDSVRLKADSQKDYSDNIAYDKKLGVGYFSGTTANLIMEGNVLSLFYDDNFNDGETHFIGAYSFNNFGANSNIVNAENIFLGTIVDRFEFVSMFAECTSLKVAPKLPYTTIDDGCYMSMFYGCTSLERSPELKAEEIPFGAYRNMFMNCTNLKHITMLATRGISQGLTNWVQNVAEIGIFVKNSEATWDVRGINGVPENWIIQNG